MEEEEGRRIRTMGRMREQRVPADQHLPYVTEAVHLDMQSKAMLKLTLAFQATPVV